MKSYWLQAITLLACVAFPLSASSNGDDPQLLWIKYQEIRGGLNDSAAGIPIYVRSDERKNVLNAEVYGVLDYPLNALVAALAIPANWCEFSILHPNVKACAEDHENGQGLLTLYLGRKSGESRDDTFELKFRFRSLYLNDEYFKASLEGDEGPLGARNHRFEVEAMKVDYRTFVRVRFSYQPKLITRIFTKVYLATHGRSKVGFSIVGVDKAGYPIYAKGKKALIERNVMRCYLALIAFMDTQHLATRDRFEARISYWFDLTEKYFSQPYELAREEYLAAKRRDRVHQLEQLQPPLAQATDTTTRHWIATDFSRWVPATLRTHPVLWKEEGS
ncbi:MAG: hypothetical protein OES46_11945 [Gammaproteobacteria bacterium]|nr:hypothetical protein [Gammaproteobacteria bacterium]